MRLLVVCLLVCACDQGKAPALTPSPSAPAPTARDAGAVVVVAPDASPPPSPPPRAPDNSKLKNLQAQLGAEATTCAGTAKLLAAQGTASPETVQSREQAVLRLCKQDKWPLVLRECVASADYDQLSCTSHLTTAKQRKNWNAAFETW